MDFGGMIAASGLGAIVKRALVVFASEFERGEFVTLTNEKDRARLLPFLVTPG